MSKRRRKKQNNSWVALLAMAVIGFLLYSYQAGQQDSPSQPPEFAPGGGIAVHYIDVGQGDSILIKSAEGTMLIDAAERVEADKIEAYLRDEGVDTLDYVVATHPHADHIGGLTQMVENFDVKHILMPKAPSNTKTYENLLNAIDAKGLKATAPIAGDVFSMGNDMKFTVLAPGSGDYEDLNDYSIVLRMDYGEQSFIFTGDAGELSEEEMIASGLPTEADFLKVGHHGSYTASSTDFLNAVHPTVAVISCGTNNDYGHPHKETMDKLNERGIAIYRTDEQGDIVVRTDGTEEYGINTTKK